MPFSNINASIALGMLQTMVERLPDYLDGPHVFADVRLLQSENVPYAVLSISSVLWHALEVQRRQGELSVDDHILIKDVIAKFEGIKTKQTAQYQSKLRSEMKALVDAWIGDVEAERADGMSLRALPADLERRRTQVDRLLENIQTEMDVLELRRRLRLSPPPARRGRPPRAPTPPTDDDA